MKSKSFTRAKRWRCPTRRLAALIRQLKTSRARAERRAARQILRHGAEPAPIIRNHPGHDAWTII